MKKEKFQFLLSWAGMEIAFFMPLHTEEEEEGMFMVTALIFPSNYRGCRVPAFQGVAACWVEVVNELLFSLLAHASLAFC